MAGLRYLSVCSGIEAATVAWHSLGWAPVAFSEVDTFPRAVLKHHYPSVPNWGDMTKFKEWPDATIDLLVGGTPCQSFSVAGLRKGLADPRGNLALTFLAIADRYRPRWVVWENVPGVLSADSHDSPDPCPPPCDLDGDDGPVDGTEVVVEDEYDADEVHAFACLVAGFSELGYFGAYGTLDAQYFNLAQRRARVFAVFHLGDWHRAAAVLFDRESLSGHPAPRRETGQGAAIGTLGGTSPGGGWRFGADEAAAGQLFAFGGNNTSGPIDVATAVNAHGGPAGRLDFESETFVAHAFDARQSDVIQYGDMTGPLDTDGSSIAIAFDTTQMRDARSENEARSALAVRRLTVEECEFLQGFPRGYTLIPYRGKPAADGPRYKALGNAMAVPVMRWIGARIQMVEQIASSDVED